MPELSTGTIGRATMSTQQEQIEIYIDEELDATQRSVLVAQLEEERGIISAWFEGGDHHRLRVRYEQENFSQATLLDTIKDFGFRGRIIRSSGPHQGG
jgi:hypothetical protein